MSKQEQAALMAWINSFRPSRRITSFENLADGRAFMELLSGVDPTHFKNHLPTRGPGAGPSSPDNWVLKINSLKRIYRLLLSFQPPPPHRSLSTSTLPEPPFSVIVKSPTSVEGAAGLIQLARMVLCVAVWAPGNEKVIAKIQGLGEGYMAELMRGIEEIMGSMPPEEEGDGDDVEEMGMMDRLSRRGSPVKRSLVASSPPGMLRVERDRLTAENEELRLRAEQLAIQVEDITMSLDETKSERDDALARLANARDTSSAALRSSQGAGNDVANLRSELLKAEEIISKSQEELSSKTTALSDLQVMLEKFEEEVSDANKLKDRLDEYRHIEEKLRKSENVIEKYKKKLEDTAVVRRDLKNLEEENAQLLSINNGLESELKKVGQGKSSSEGSREQLVALEAKVAAQANELSELSTQLDTTRMQLYDTELAHERDKEDLELYRQKLSELELGSGDISVGLENQGGSLGNELEGFTSPAETRTDLKLKIRRLERELADRSSFTGASDAFTLQSQLQAAEASRDQYLALTKSLQAELSQLRLGRNVDSQTSIAEPDYSVFEEAQKSYEAQISRLKSDLETARTDSKAIEKRYKVEQELMLSAWHDLGNKVVREHLGAVVNGAKRSQSKVIPMGWLGRQQRWKEDAIFSDRIMNSSDLV